MYGSCSSSFFSVFFTNLNTIYLLSPFYVVRIRNCGEAPAAKRPVFVDLAAPEIDRFATRAAGAATANSRAKSRLVEPVLPGDVRSNWRFFYHVSCRFGDVDLWTLCRVMTRAEIY